MDINQTSGSGYISDKLSGYVEQSAAAHSKIMTHDGLSRQRHTANVNDAKCVILH